MDANELLREWPEWSKANAARVLASSAWRLETQFGGKDARLVRVDALAADATVALDIRLDEEPHVLAIEPTPLFPDLTLLKGRFADLPKEVLLALVEKEGGVLFQFVEEISHHRLAIVGLSASPVPETAFVLSGEGGEARFALDLSAEMEQRLGVLANLDVTHPSIRNLTREAIACHGEWTLNEAELAALSVGDCLVPDEGFEPRWLLEVPADERAYALVEEKGSLSFAQLADDALPSVPPSKTLMLCRGGSVLATLEPSCLGLARTFRVVRLQGA